VYWFIIFSYISGVVVEECTPDEVFALLDDEYARSLLSATSHEPMTAPELSNQCDMSVSTVYRRLNKLEDCGLVGAEHVPDPDGNHTKRYEAQLDELVVSLTDGDFAVNLQTATRTQEFADAFTDLWEGL
jgi:predicted transcriptional regulator